MMLCDVNIFLYAYRSDTQDHKKYNDWLSNLINSRQPYGVSDLVFSSVIRIATHNKIFNPPSSSEDILIFIEQIRGRSNAVSIKPGPRHWSIYTDLIKVSNAKGNLIPDAYFAALAIEHGCTWVSSDSDFAKFPDLDWKRPF